MARRLVAALAALLIFLALILAALWIFRMRIASEYIDRELRKRDIDATYDVRRIGLGSQVFENLVIGDPDNPDLTARRVEVEVVLGLGGPRVGLITARGVRMRGRIVDGRLDLGQLDRLTPPAPEDAPFRLPDQRVDIADSAIVIDSPAGRFALSLDGRGNLADGFRGRMALASRGLALGECRIPVPRGRLAVSVDDLQPSFSGPVEMEAIRCGEDFLAARPRFDADVTLGADLESWRGRAGFRSAALRAGPNRMADLSGEIGFEGDAELTSGAARVGAAASSAAGFEAARTGFSGRYSLSPLRGGLRLEGDLALSGLTVEPGTLAPLAEGLRSIGDFPVAPVGEALADALVRAARSGAEARADLSLVNRSGTGAVRFGDLTLESRSGLRLRASGGEGISYSWPAGGLAVDGDVALSGGGLPDARFTLRQPRPGAPIEGRGRIAPIAAGGARLELGEIRFTAAPDGTTRLRTVARMSGPFQGGRVQQLTLPVEGRFGAGGFAFGEGCVTARFQSFRYGNLELGPTRLPLCPTGRALVHRSPGGSLQGGAAIRAPRLAGRIGGSPLAIAADRLRFGLADADFAAAGVEAAIGDASSATRIDIGSLTGRFGRRGPGGAFESLATRIPGVPLDFGEGRGEWRIEDGVLSLGGHLRVADTQDPPRFYPLETDDFRLTLDGSDIRAGGWLHDPDTGARITEATLVHDLSTGAGSAVLDVPGISFALGGLQPEDLTPLTVGVAALVDGTVTGRGTIRWDSERTTSSGTFATADMDLAAPFGPVEGLTTSIEFTDLLGLVSAPGQVATVDLVRTGVDVYDGRVVYQLLPDYRVEVETGRWPFAGGELFLEPTMLDFGQPSTKYLTFRVVGLDAAHFVQQMDFANIAATGTFDGVIPMQFDARGGSIVGGRLSARPPGGTLSYVGELTDRDLGVYGKLAFDALKALRYSRFDILLDGSLDGEFFTHVELDGVARDPALATISGGGIRGILARRALTQLARIPFEFNIRIQGPFRALIATAGSFDDPTSLIQQALPEMLRGLPTEAQDVQDEESEDMR